MRALESSAGGFWSSENTGVYARGELVVQVREAAELKPERGLIGEMPRSPRPRPVFKPGDMAGAMLAHATASIAHYREILIHGRLDSGDLVTLIDANNHGGRGLGVPPRYVAQVAVFGAHVAPEQLYSTVRFRLDDPYWLGHLANGDSSVVSDDESVLRVEAHPGGGNWLVYESSSPASLRQLEIRVMSSCLAFAELALYPDEQLVICETQVRVNDDDDWLDVLGPAFCGESSSPRLDTLLPRAELTVERFAEWIELNDEFDGLAWAVAPNMPVAVQAQVQLLTSMVEGFHRRLRDSFEQSWFPKSSKAALQRVRKAAAEAAAEQAGAEGLDRDLMYERVKNALGHVGDKSYLERAEEVVAKVCAVVPEIAESVDRLEARLTEPRHSFAHQLPQDDKKDPLDDRIRRWIVVAKVTPWLLRALLLLEVGVDPATLREKYLEFQQFAFSRINVEQRVLELGWNLPPLELDAPEV